MKRNKLLTVLPLAALLLAGGVSCTNDLSEGLPDASPEGLAIAFNTGEGGFTRAVDVPDNSALREDYVDHVDVFIFDGATGQIVQNGTEGNCYWRVTASQMEENQTRTQTLLDGDWKTAPLSGTDYDVYVVANLHGTGNLNSVTTVDDLKKVVETDEEVYRVYNSSTYADKLFTMTGKVENWNPQTVQEDEYILPVTLTRVAAKIEISLQLTEEFKQKYQPTSFTQQLRNYAASALLIEGSDDTFAYEQASSTENPALTFNTTEGTATLVLYTYPTEWNADVLKETYVIANIPVVNQDPQEGEEPTISRNYYKIPLRAVADNKVLERNHIYRVNATVDMLGTYTPDIPVELETVKYEVATWVDETVNISGDNPKYLILSEEKIIMRNIADYDELSFASSSDIESAVISDIYFIDKNGKRQTVSNRNINATFDKGLNGYLHINSPVPTNKTIRYMTLTVKNKQGETRTVTIEQYPLEYITGIAGYHSYRKDFNSSRYPNPCTYEYRGSQKVMWGSSSPYGDGGFQSKAYVNGQLGTFDWDRQYVDFQYESGWGQNNRMYHVVITATSDEYTLARPLMDTKRYQDGAGNWNYYDITAEGSENDNLVSPSFMLASQLGMVWEMSWSDAQKQCAMYVEKGMNGKVYDDWRLPTAAELKIIAKYQSTAKDVMDEVLSGDQYWSSRTNYVLVKSTLRHQYSSARNPIRCIRDFNPNDPIE